MLHGHHALRGISDEVSWFNQNRAMIVQKYAGQYILVKDKSVRGVYKTYDAAFTAGIQQFGPQGGFLVKLAVMEDPKVTI